MSIRIALVLLSMLSVSKASMGSGTSPPANNDCGVNALFVLFHLLGHPVSLEQLDRALPARHPEGFSLAELALASESLGMPLKGWRFDRGDGPLREPAIAFFKDVQVGHFVVLRPVGTTGTMVQVIDPPHAPRIVDERWLFQGKMWTGRILARERPRTLAHVALLMAGSSALVFLAIAARRLTRRSSGFPRKKGTRSESIARPSLGVDSGQHDPELHGSRGGP